MSLSKFPVYSESGKEYKAEVSEHRYFGNSYIVELYLPYRGLFNKEKWKHVSGGIFEGRYDVSDWGYNFVAMAKSELNDYEAKIEKIRLDKLNEQIGIEEFEKWDGK